MNRLSRILFIAAGAVLLLGIVSTVANGGRQWFPALCVAIILAAIGLAFQQGRRRG